MALAQLFTRMADAPDIVGLNMAVGDTLIMGGSGFDKRASTYYATAASVSSLSSTVSTLSATVSGISGTYATISSLDSLASTVTTHAANVSNPHSVTKSQVGLSNVDNTSDANKPVSTATQTALDLKAPLASPTFTGTPIVPTASQGTNTTQAASTAFVVAEVAALVDSSPGTLNTLNELAAAMGDDPNFAATTAAAIGAKADASALTSHTGNTSNPHSVTKSQVGLGSVDNTSDSAKPISTATQTALDAKASASDLSTHTGNTSNPHSVTKSQIGLGNVANVDTTVIANITGLQTTIDTINNEAFTLANDFQTHVGDMDNPHGVDASDVGLGNVENVDQTNADNLASGTVDTDRLPGTGIAWQDYADRISLAGSGVSSYAMAGQFVIPAGKWALNTPIRIEGWMRRTVGAGTGQVGFRSGGGVVGMPSWTQASGGVGANVRFMLYVLPLSASSGTGCDIYCEFAGIGFNAFQSQTPALNEDLEIQIGAASASGTTFQYCYLHTASLSPNAGGW